MVGKKKYSKEKLAPTSGRQSKMDTEPSGIESSTLESRSVSPDDADLEPVLGAKRNRTSTNN